MNNLDELLYSRQIYTIGQEAVIHLRDANVLLCGFQGLGAEVAKNLVLLGVRSVTIVESTTISAFRSSSSHIFLRNEDRDTDCVVGVSVPRLAALNPAVVVRQHKGGCIDVSQFEGVIATNQTTDSVLDLSDLCHGRNIPFVYVQTKGVFGRVFCDLGEFTSKGAVVEPPEYRIIELVEEGPVIVKALVLVEDVQLPLEGDTVEFCTAAERLAIWSGNVVVRGATRQNTCWIEIRRHEPCTVNREKKHQRAKRSRKDSYLLRQVMPHQEWKQDSLARSLQGSPKLAVPDCGGGTARKLTQHIGLQTLELFYQCFQRYPSQQQDVPTFVQLAAEYNQRHRVMASDAVDMNILKIMALTHEGDISPMAMIMGGIAVQELVKGICRQYAPVDQWFYFDAMELVDVDNLFNHPEDYTLKESDKSIYPERYWGNIRLLGKANQEALHQAIVFLVGCGAVGCELLKSCVLLGIGTQQGRIEVTDMDVIEKSNLSRQFLFTNSDIGKFKSEVAAKAVTAINPEAEIVARRQKVGEDNEEEFDDTFFSSVDVMLTALDSLPPRLYIDKKCVLHGKPLINPGTDGLLLSMEVSLPKFTQSLTQRRMHELESKGTTSKKEYAPCTLRYFPHRIEHTLAWAKDAFIGHFTTSITYLQQYLSDPALFIEDVLSTDVEVTAYEKLLGLCGCYHKGRFFAEKDCIAWARALFEEYFVNRIERLLKIFPPDALNSENAKEPFWAGTRSLPVAIEFSVEDSTHLEFVCSVAQLRANTLGIAVECSASNVVRTLDVIAESWREYPVRETLVVPPMNDTSENEELASLVEKEPLASSDDEEQQFGQLMSHIPTASAPPTGCLSSCLAFEKDDNLHMLFVNSAANLRARNYKIPESDLNASRRKVGDIIPAIITTTTVVSGLACIEMLKTLLKPKGHRGDKHKEYCWDLSDPLNGVGWYNIPVSETVQKRSIGGRDYTEWDLTQVKDTTLGELLELLQAQHSIAVDYILAGSMLVYHRAIFSETKKRNRLQQRLSCIWEELHAAPLTPKTPFFLLTINGDEFLTVKVML